ncbi:MAG: substrate-binding domain-containing protein [Planctomycetota bacterium]|jgi:DNA-binding LacI/PurR family transcriptional regulator
MSQYKYQFVADKLRSGIKNHEYPTGVLPAEQDLMKQFKVGKKTVYNALTMLSEEGTITRTKGKGTFINGAEGRGLTMSHYVPVIMRHTGHIYSSLSLYLRQELAKNSYFSVPLDDQYEGKIAEQLYKDNLFLLLNSNISGIIFDGSGYWKFPFLAHYPDLPAVAVSCYEGFEEAPCSTVLIDYEEGIKSITSYLVEQNLENIAFLSMTSPEKKTRSAGRPITLAHKGYLKAMENAKLEKNSEIIYAFHNFEDTVRGVLARKNRPEAIVCFSDIEAVKIVNIAAEMGLSIPDDIKVTGFYNTPWCEECSVKLTSVNINENKIAETAVNVLTEESGSRQTIKIKPEIVIRESTSL